MGQLISDKDLLGVFTTLGNDVATINGTVTVTGVFSNKYQALDPLTGIVVETAIPNFMCRTSDVTSVANGQSFVLNGNNYVIKTLEPDGEGSTLIFLHK